MAKYLDQMEYTMATMYQKRHYEDVARVLREAKASMLVSCREDTLAVWNHTALLFATQFARDNAQFSHSRFLEAAGYRV